MITVVQERDDIWTVQIDTVNMSLLGRIATGFGMPFSVAVASCLLSGITHNMVILQEIAAHESRKRRNDKIRSEEHGEAREEQEQAQL